MSESPDPAAAKPRGPGSPEIGDNALDDGLRAAFGKDARQTQPLAEDHPFDTTVAAPVRLGPQTRGEANTGGFQELGGPALPEEIGRYRVTGEIGRGGVGAVMKARDLDLGRDVAVKVLLDAHRGDAQMTRRLMEEAQISGQLQHPGVVPVYEMGLFAGDRPYFAMKLLEGKTLSTLLDERKDPAESRLRLLGIFEQVCQTLAYAHARGVIHRDMKPSNIMVGSFGEVQVMDWGLAKVIERQEPGDLRASERPEKGDILRTHRSEAKKSDSRTGTVMGTPAYMAPEQARGEMDSLDERTDVFGLGAILCEILTGKPPYAGETVDDLYRMARSGRLEETHRRLETSGADARLIAIAKACLAAEAKDRPASAGVLAAEIRDYLESLQARARTLEIKAAKARIKLAFVATALLGLVAAGAVYLRLDEVNKKEEAKELEAVNLSLAEAVDLRSLARESGMGDMAQWEAVSREAREALELAQDLDNAAVLERARNLRAEIDEEVKDRRMVSRLERIREDRGFVLGALESSLREAVLGRGIEKDTESAFEELDGSFRQAFAEYGMDVDAMEPEVTASRIRESKIGAELVLALDQWATLWKLDPARDPSVGEAFFRLAQLSDEDSWRRRLRGAEAAGDVETLVNLAQDRESQKAAASTLEFLAYSLKRLGQDAMGKSVLEKAQELHPGDFWINACLGRDLLDDGRLDEAMRCFTAAVALRPQRGYAHHLLALAFAASGRRAEAIAQFEKDIRLDPEACRSYYGLSQLLETGGSSFGGADLDELLETLREIARDGKPYHHDGLVRLLAQVLHRRGESAEAILVLEESARVPGAQHGSFPFLGSGDTSHVKLLQRYRKEALPDLVSFASIDHVLDGLPPRDAGAGPAPAPDDPREVLREFQEMTTDQEKTAKELRKARLAYLEARLLERAGSWRAASEKLQEVLSLQRDFPEPWLRLAESLRAGGEPSRAEKVLRDVLRRADMQYVSLWNTWLAIYFVDLGRTPSALLSALPKAGRPQAEARESTVFKIPTDYADDVRWLLERLASHEAIRINCGGDDYRSPGGASWSRDRFFTVGGTEYLYGKRKVELPIEGTSDDGLYQTERWFSMDPGWPVGYRFPLPPGAYRVTLHFAEIYYRARSPGKQPERVFDVFLEGKPVLQNYSPLSKGFATAEVRAFTVEVADGVLDITFLHRVENPKISGIEIEPAR